MNGSNTASLPLPAREDSTAHSGTRACPLATAEGLLAEVEPRGQISWSIDAEASREERADAYATRLMDAYRRTRRSDVFEALVAVASPALMRRVRARVRCLADHLDPNELFQDTIINVYSYPDRFDAGRPGAFRAWSSTIVDNTIRRHLRRARSGPDIALSPVEILAQQPDAASRQPSLRAMNNEALRSTLRAYSIFLQLYLSAYQRLSERERFVLQMVEVRGMRYAELGRLMGIRPEALKMVVFRARKRIAQRMRTMMPQTESREELALAS